MSQLLSHLETVIAESFKQNDMRAISHYFEPNIEVKCCKTKLDKITEDSSEKGFQAALNKINTLFGKTKFYQIETELSGFSDNFTIKVIINGVYTTDTETVNPNHLCQFSITSSIEYTLYTELFFKAAISPTTAQTSINSVSISEKIQNPRNVTHC